MSRIEICVLNVKEKFKSWIETRGGVRVWENVDMSSPGRPPQFTPLRDEHGVEYGKPHWAYQAGEVITDLSRFRFATEIKEVDRFKISTRMGSQGFTIKLTAASSRKVDERCERAKGMFGASPVYHFEDKECVLSVPVFED